MYVVSSSSLLDSAQVWLLNCHFVAGVFAYNKLSYDTGSKLSQSGKIGDCHMLSFHICSINECQYQVRLMQLIHICPLGVYCKNSSSRHRSFVHQLIGWESFFCRWSMFVKSFCQILCEPIDLIGLLSPITMINILTCVSICISIALCAIDIIVHDGIICGCALCHGWMVVGVVLVVRQKGYWVCW